MNNDDQGAVAVMIQKLDAVIAKQLGVPNAVDRGYNFESDHDSAASDLSDVEDCAEGTSEPVEGACSLNQGMKILIGVNPYFLVLRCDWFMLSAFPRIPLSPSLLLLSSQPQRKKEMKERMPRASFS